MAGDFVQTFLVTGGAGFIGSHFIGALSALPEDVRVVNVDALTYASTPSLSDEAARDGRCVFVHADVRDEAAMRVVFARYRPDIVVHFAAESHVDRSIADPMLFQDVNVGGTATLLEAARSAWACGEGRLFVHVSTDEVYGDLPFEPADATGSSDAFREDAPLRPRSPYAASKAAAEMFVRAYGETYGLPAVIVRCSNNYGPRQHAEKLIPKAIACALAGKPLPLYGSGRNVRDWLYVGDCCRGILAAVRKGRSGEAYNLGGACPVSNAALLLALQDELRAASEGRLSLEFEHVADRLGHDRRYAMDCRKAAAELGWRPTTAFRDGLRSTVAWYLARARG